MRWFRKLPPIAKASIELALIAAVLCFLFGPIGFVYTAGFQVLYWLIGGIAAVLDPKTFKRD
jgi:ABC-type polysaccharide/polyol phosphate export permease